MSDTNPSYQAYQYLPEEDLRMLLRAKKKKEPNAVPFIERALERFKPEYRGSSLKNKEMQRVANFCKTMTAFDTTGEGSAILGLLEKYKIGATPQAPESTPAAAAPAA